MLETILRRQPQDGTCLFVDMNSFFASCEQQVAPELRGRPVGVCPFVANATCVIAASVEAKRYGVKTGTNVGQAKLMCPEIVLLPANPRLYREFHRQIMAQLDNTRCRVIAKSVDEALLQVPQDLRGHSRELASEVKLRIGQIGSALQCSVGIGPNMFLAKMGSNYQKPDGLVEITTSQELAGHQSTSQHAYTAEDFYGRLQLTDLHGVAWRLARRLKAIGIRTPLDFYHASHALLKQSLGVNGEAWYLRLRGYEVDLKPTRRRMIGHQSTIVPKPAHTVDEVMSVASQLTYRAATRLRAARLAARGVVVYVRFVDRTSWHRVYHGRQPFADSASFYHHVERLLRWRRLPQPVRLVGVSAIDLLDSRCLPQSLFDQSERHNKLSAALDEINFRYGEATIRTARQLQTGVLHDAIGFGNSVHNVRELPV